MATVEGTSKQGPEGDAEIMQYLREGLSSHLEQHKQRP